MGGYAKENEPSSSVLPVMAYDEDHCEAWTDMLSGPPGAGDHTIVTLQNVSVDPVPVRWLRTIGEAAHTWERLETAGIATPKSWKLLAPLHINAACNDGDAEGALDQAQRLWEFTKRYVGRFHPRVPIPELEVDNPAWVSRLMEHGTNLYPHLPDHVKGTLGAMASKHDSGNSTDAHVTSYLLAHYEAYGRLDGVSFGGFPKRKNTIFIVPQSEDTFHQLMDLSEDAMNEAGIPPVHMKTNGNMLMVSSGLRSPHYYAHKGEPSLVGVTDKDRWPTVNRLSRKGINGRALEEIIKAVAYIESDIGGKDQIGELADMISSCLI